MATDFASPATPRNRGVDHAPHQSPITPAEDARTILINSVSWGAVLAGVAVALVAQLVLNMIGIGIGAASLNIAASDTPTASGFSIGAAIWWTVAGVIASFAGGYAAGRLAGRPKGSTSGWHGLTAWAMTTLVIFYLLTSTIGGIIGGAYQGIAGAVGNVASGAVQTAVPAIANSADPFASIEQAVRGTSIGTDPAAARDAAISAMRALVTGSEAQAEEARNRAANAFAQAQNIPVDQARTQVQQYEQQYRETVEQAKQKAIEAADTAAKAVSMGALFGAFALLIGALAAWFGGVAGSVDPTLTSGYLRSLSRNS